MWCDVLCCALHWIWCTSIFVSSSSSSRYLCIRVRECECAFVCAHRQLPVVKLKFTFVLLLLTFRLTASQSPYVWMLSLFHALCRKSYQIVSEWFPPTELTLQHVVYLSILFDIVIGTAYFVFCIVCVFLPFQIQPCYQFIVRLHSVHRERSLETKTRTFYLLNLFIYSFLFIFEAANFRAGLLPGNRFW